MMLSSCPKCHEPVTVPHGASSQSRVRCPLCQEEYSLGELLDKLPPSLILLDGVAIAAPESAADEYAIAADQPGVAVATEAETSAAPAFQFDESDAPQTRQAPSYTVAARPRRRRKNPLVEVLKIVGGGVAGLVLAQIILWWLPLDPRKDPFDLGPTVGRYVPWIVPAVLREAPTENVDTATDDDTDSYFDSAFPTDPSTDDGATRDDSTDNDYFNTPSDDSTPPARGDGSATTSSGTSGDPPPATTRRGDEGAAGSAETVGIRNASRTTSGDLSKAIGRVRRSEIAWSSSNDLPMDERIEAAQQLYASLVHLATVMTHLDRNDQRVVEQAPAVKKTLRELAEDQYFYNLIARTAPQWLADENRDSQGVVLVGTVQRIDVQEKLHESRIELARSGEVVSVFGWEEPPEFFKPDAEVLVLGVFVQDPSARLIGYTGDSGEVICGGFVVPLPARSSP